MGVLTLMASCFEELFPGLLDQLSLEPSSQPEWCTIEGRLYNQRQKEFRYSATTCSDVDYEHAIAKHWLQDADCIQTIDGPGLEKSLFNLGEEFRVSGFSSLHDLNLSSIHDSGIDYHTSWACNELYAFLARHHYELGAIRDYSGGLLLIHGICNGETLANLIKSIRPRLILIFERRLNMIPLVISEHGADSLLRLLKQLNANLFVISDDQADNAYIKARGLIESVNIFCQERVFIISFFGDDIDEQIQYRFRHGESMLKDLRLLGFFVDELHMMLNSSITFSLLPPKIVSYGSVDAHDRHAVVTASGPSLGNMLTELADHRDCFDLFCSYSTLRSLLLADLLPDYHCNQERHACHIPILRDDLCKDFAKHATLLCSANNDPRMNALYHQSVAFYRSASCASALFAESTDQCISGEGTQVANLALYFAVLLGYRTIHLAGVDLGTAYPEATREDNALSMSYRTFDVPVPGNLRDRVWSSQPMIESAEFMSMLISGAVLPDQKPIENLTIYNYSDGQLIRGTVSSCPSEFACNVALGRFANVKRDTPIMLLPTIDSSRVRSRWLGFDWRERTCSYAEFLRSITYDPLISDNLEIHLKAAERQLQQLQDQVLTRMMAGTLSRIWYFIMMADSRLPPLSDEEYLEWKVTAHRVLREVIDSMEALTLEMVAYTEGLRAVDDYQLVSKSFG